MPDTETQEQPRDWYFTWGCGQGHDNCYTVIRGTFATARKRMFELWGSKWAMQYSSADKAGVEEYMLTRVK